MKQEALAYFSDIQFTIIALILFIVTFGGIVWWAYRGSAKNHFQKMAELPLKERENHVRSRS